MKTIPYYHVDVFSNEPFSGNGLTIFTGSEAFTKATMQKLTQEMRQFESIFLQNLSDGKVRAYIFTCEEELDFAGHPILGAASTLHDLVHPLKEKTTWTFELNKQTVTVVTERKGDHYEAVMNQGIAKFGRVLNNIEAAGILECIGLHIDDLYPGCFPTVVSTGLPYLLIPLQKNAFISKIGAPNLQERIELFGAKFIGIMDIPALSIRSGDNKGAVEDIATGSLAGPVGAYLVKHGFQEPDTLIQLHQGKNLGRPSQLFVKVEKKNDRLTNVFVSGSVCKIAQGVLYPQPHFL